MIIAIFIFCILIYFLSDSRTIKSLTGYFLGGGVAGVIFYLLTN